MARARRLALLLAAPALFGCGSSAPKTATVTDCAPQDIRSASQLEPGAKALPSDHLDAVRRVFARFVPDSSQASGVVTNDGVAVLAAPITSGAAEFFDTFDKRTHWEHLSVGGGDGRIGRDQSGSTVAVGMPTGCTLVMVTGSSPAAIRRVATGLHG